MTFQNNPEWLLMYSQHCLVRTFEVCLGVTHPSHGQKYEKCGKQQKTLEAAECAVYSTFKGRGEEAKKMPLFLCEISTVHHALIMKFELKRMKGKLSPQYKVYLFWKQFLTV